MTTSDPRETEHIECDCVPDLGPSHCHLCSERAGHPVPWSEAHPNGVIGNYTKLLREADRADGFDDLGQSSTLPKRLAWAIRDEQRARLAAEARALSEGARVEYTRSALIRLQRRIDATLQLCEEHELGALRWEHPLPVPEWIPLVRAALTESKEPDHE